MEPLITSTPRMHGPRADVLQQGRSAQSGSQPPHADTLHALGLILFGISLFVTNRWFTQVDDECAIIDRAARPVFETIRLYLQGGGEHEHPPLYDLILHVWLQLTNGEQYLLRVPAIIFYIVGVWVLASAVRRQAGGAAGRYTMLAIVLWPYGFHFGRLAAWYSFCFFLVASLTSAYLRYVDSPQSRNWFRLVVCSILLLYSNYFAWAQLACLGLDFVIRNWRMPLKRWAGVAGTCSLFLLLYLPIRRPFFTEIHAAVRPIRHLPNLAFAGIYNLYCVFVSESVAPWFWSLGIPAGLAIAGCLAVTLCSVPREARRFLFYFVLIVTAMTFVGVANTKRMLFISPWLILPVSIALAHQQRKWYRRMLSGSLLFIAAVGWYGIFARNLYAAPHWVEPWQAIAKNAASAARGNGIIIGNNPSFFYYLTYDLGNGRNGVAPRFAGLLPDSVRRRNVYSAPQWNADGHPLAAQVMVVKGAHFQIPSAPMEQTEQWLNAHCMSRTSQRMVRDAGAELKQQFAPGIPQPTWRIEILTYACR